MLDSVSSPITKRVYNLGLDEFFAWYDQEPRPGFTKATVSAWRVALEARGLGAVSINVRITAVRKLAVEAADNGLLAPELANGITRVKGAKSKAYGWETGSPSSRPRVPQLPGHYHHEMRDRAMVFIRSSASRMSSTIPMAPRAPPGAAWRFSRRRGVMANILVGGIVASPASARMCRSMSTVTWCD